MIGKKYLENIVILRISLIILLVLHHSFAPYSDAWASFTGMEPSFVYKAIASTSRTLMLPVFVFISGYLYGYAVLRNPNTLSFRVSVFNKAKRLIIPSLFFSIIYSLMFNDWHMAFADRVAIIICGAGHLWFLPMLFVCFVACFFIAKISDKTAAFVIACIAAICPPLPAEWSEAVSLWGVRFDLLLSVIWKSAEYFIYFYFGFIAGLRFIDQILSFISSRNGIIIGILIFIIAKIALTYFNQVELNTECDNERLFQMLLIILQKFCALVCGLSGVCFFYGFVENFLVGRINNTSILVKLSGYCFGVYVYQQFILISLYYHSSFPEILPIYFVPWVMFIIALIASLILTWLTLKTSLGRYLIG